EPGGGTVEATGRRVYNGARARDSRRRSAGSGCRSGSRRHVPTIMLRRCALAERLALGLDIGGTFTDFVLLDETSGDLRVHKRLTSYPDPADAVLAGVEELLPGRDGLDPAGLRILVHSTTLVTNAVIEHKGAP